MTADTAEQTCQQAVFAADDCCRSETCQSRAVWFHRAAGAALCAEHEGNARKWSSGGIWRVGDRDIPYPDGWDGPDDAAPAAGATRLELVEIGDALRIEREPLGPR